MIYDISNVYRLNGKRQPLFSLFAEGARAKFGSGWQATLFNYESGGREFESLRARQIASKIGVTALNVLATLPECSVGACFEFSFE
jgi:hypothetical protein